LTVLDQFVRAALTQYAQTELAVGYCLAKTQDDYHHARMQTVFEAAGGMNGMRRLASAWHRRVMADDVVGHAFSHGFHPQHVERLAANWAEALGPIISVPYHGNRTPLDSMECFQSSTRTPSSKNAWRP
jgi:hypothetical protein